MTGLAFTVGLLIGLCLHLPGVSSPLQAPTWRQGPLLQALGRSQRRARAVPTQEDSHPGGEASQALRKIQSDLGSPPKKASAENATLEGGHGLRIQQRVQAVQAAYARIRAVRSSSSNSNSGQGLIKPNRQLHKDPSERGEVSPTPRQQNRLSLGRVFLPKTKKHHQRAGKADPDPPAEKDDTPVYGSKTVSVMVTAGQAPPSSDSLKPPPPPQAPLTDTSQSLVSGHNAGRQAPSTSRTQDQDVDVAPAPGRRRQGGDLTRLRQDQFRTLEDLVADGIYWSHKMELLVPPGFSDDEVRIISGITCPIYRLTANCSFCGREVIINELDHNGDAMKLHTFLSLTSPVPNYLSD